MSDEDLKKAEKMTYAILDSIDLIPYIKRHIDEDIYGLMDELSDDYDTSPEANNKLLEGCLFNVIGSEEFIEYLEKRYNGQFSIHEIITKHICFKD